MPISSEADAGQAMLAVLAGDATRARLPEGAEPLAGPPRIHAVPGAALPLIGLTVADGGAFLPVLLAPGLGTAAPGAWVRLPAPADAILGAKALVAAEPGDPPLPASWLAPGVKALPALPAPPASRGGDLRDTPRAAAARAGAATLRAVTGEAEFDLPTTAVRRVLPAETVASALQPVPGGLQGALGHLATGIGPALLLDPRNLPGGERAKLGGALLILFEHAGALLALAADRVGLGDAGRADALMSALPGAAALSAAPRPIASRGRGLDRDSAEGIGRAVVVARAGGARFALLASEVSALLPSGTAAAPPQGAPPQVVGLRAHRGEVLPVLDAGEVFGAARGDATALARRPLLRLATVSPVALAVDELPALRRLPEDAFAPALEPMRGLVSAIAAIGGDPLPLCHAEAFAALALPASA